MRQGTVALSSVLSQANDLGVNPGRLLIGGEWVEATSDQTWPHVHPATEEHVTDIAVASVGDVDRAVSAAREAFDRGPWPELPARERVALLRKISTAIRDRADELNRLQTLDNGMPIQFAKYVYQVKAEVLADLFDYYAGWADKAGGQTLPSYTRNDVFEFTLREPVGVVGSIIPWNAPLILLGLKLAPALAAGCTVVLKPSEYASLTALRVGEILVEAGLPPGVINIVTGPGAEVGEPLITHPNVDKLAFTGSRSVGQRVMRASAEGIKRVSLELGGKSANIIFDDAPDLDLAAVTMIGAVAMGLSGQGCACLTRALVHHSIHDEVVAKALEFAGKVRQGDPFDKQTNAGPLINKRQHERVLGYIERGVEEGAELVCGGGVPADLDRGWWVEPTMFAGVDNSSTIAQEEIFGPVLAVIPFRDEDEAIRLANDSNYGLAGAVFTSNFSRAMRVTKAIRTGTFGINTYQVIPNAPFGGYKQSGMGREGGAEQFDLYTEVKTVTAALGDHVPMG